MPNLSQKSPFLKHSGLIQGIIFFTLFYLWVWLKIDPRLIYYGGGVVTNFPVFYRGWDFFLQFTSYPGGPLEYLFAFLSQLLYYPLAGALVITLSAVLISLFTDIFIKAINGRRLRWVSFIPPILVLITYNQYTYHFVTIMALPAALSFACLYLRVAKAKRPVSLIVFFVLSVILYYIAGGVFILFAVLCALYELLFTRRLWTALIYLLSAAVIPYIGGVIIFGISVTEAFTDMSPLSRKILDYENRRELIEIIYILYLLLPLTALVIGFWRAAARKKIKEKTLLRWFAELCLLLAVLGGAAFSTHDKDIKTTLEVEYYTLHEMWPEVLQAFHRLPDNLFVVHTVNRALYHTGRLGYDMFSYPQHPDTLFITAKIFVQAFWRRSHVYVDLGILNLGEDSLVESLEGIGERPMILRKLALINMAKGNIGTARTYLGALSKTLFDADWANDYLDRLESDPNLSTDGEIQRLRSIMMEKDYGFTKYSPERALLALLEKNRQNRMAFEYLMAWYLLTRQLDKLVQNLDRLDDFNYPDVPRHYQEAIIIYEAVSGKKVNLKGRQISAWTYQQARAFGSIITRLGSNNKMQVMQATAGDFGDTYFFYYNFGSVLIKR